MPDEGESIAQVFEQHGEGSLVGPAIRPLPLTGSDGGTAARTSTSTPSSSTRPSARTSTGTPPTSWQRRSGRGPPPAFAEPSGPPAWKTIPCWYLLCTEDRAIPPATQRFMARRANARIETAPASHVSMLSQPEAATELILEAAEAAAPAMA